MSTPAPVTPVNVLVVEDDDIVRMLIVDVLEELEYQVLEADGCDQALDFLRNLDQRIDLMMTDIGLPVMDGRETGQASPPGAAWATGSVRQWLCRKHRRTGKHGGDRQAFFHRSIARQGQKHSFLSPSGFLVTIGAPRTDCA